MAHALTYQWEMEERKEGDINVVSPCVVTPDIDPREGQEEDSTKYNWIRRFRTGHSCYVPVSLCIFSLTSLIIIIALSTQLSLVAQQYDEASSTLEMLRQEHSINSSFTSGNITMDSEVWGSQEILRPDTLENEGKTTMTNVGHKVREEDSEVTRCQAHLMSLNSQKRVADLALSRMNVSLSDTRKKLKTKEENLSQLRATKRRLKQVHTQLQESQRRSQEQLKKLKNLEQRVRELEEDLRKLEDKVVEQEGWQDPQNKGKGHDGNSSEVHPGFFCPRGWKQIDETCYYLSSEKDVRYKAAEDCKKKNSSLAKIQDSDSTLKEMIVKDGRSFWIGLRKEENLWKWSDESLQEDFTSKSRTMCAKASPELEDQPCSTPLPWICEKKARKHL